MAKFPEQKLEYLLKLATSATSPTGERAAAAVQLAAMIVKYDLCIRPKNEPAPTPVETWIDTGWEQAYAASELHCTACKCLILEGVAYMRNSHSNAHNHCFVATFEHHNARRSR